MALLVVGGAVLAGGEIDEPSDDSDVDLPGQEVTETGTNLACEPVGCEIWRVAESAGGLVAVSDDLVVQLSQSGIVAYGAQDGQLAWERPQDEIQRPTSGPVALSDNGLAIVPEPFSSPPPDPDGWPDDGEAFVRLLDSEDGSHRGDVEVPLRQIVDVAWVEDRLVVTGQARADLGDGPAVVVVASDEEIHWRHLGDASDPPPLVADGAETLVVQESEEVVGRELSDGSDRWRVRGHLALPPGEPGWGDLLVVDRDGGEVRLVDLEDGHVRQRIAVEGAVGAARVGPWVAVATEDELRVHDPDDGRQVLRRDVELPDHTDDPQGPPVTPVTAPAAEVGDRVVVVWPDGAGDEEVELTVHRRNGTPVDTMRVDLPSDESPGEALHMRLRAVPGTDTQALLHVMGPQTPTSVWLDLDERRVLSVENSRLEDEPRRQLLAVRDDPRLHLLGPDGEIEVLHAPQVASLDPLIVHGMGGILRLEPDLLGLEELGHPEPQ